MKLHHPFSTATRHLNPPAIHHAMKTNTAPRLPSPLGRQRPLHALLLSLLAVPALLHSSAQAQSVVNGIPSYINYRGRVLNSAGVVVGETTPVNRKVTFKLWGHATSIAAGDLIYAEEQTVAILHGDFSALVGQGTRVGGSETILATAFNASERYLGVTVDDGTPTVDTEITPRQQIASSAFAFRSKFSETANNVVQTTGTSTFTNATISAGNFTGNGAGLISLNAANITSGTLATARLPILGDSQISGLSVSKLIGQVSDAQISSISAAKIGSLIANSQIQSLDAAKLTNTAALPQPSSLSALEIRSGSPYIDFTSDGTSADYNCRLIASAGARLDYQAGSHVFYGNVELVNALHSYNGISIDGQISAGQQITANGGLVVNNGGITANGGISTTNITTSGTISSANHVSSNGGMSTNAFTQYSADYDFSINSASVAGGRMIVKTDGKVGIGTNNPDAGLHVTKKVSQTFYSYVEMNDDPPWQPDRNLTQDIAIHTNGGIRVDGNVHTNSDSRIKVVKGISNGAEDMNRLLSIEVTDYRYKDHSASQAPQKKVIAQQVEKVFPQAVSKSTGVVPDIFKSATIADGWVHLATDLKKGERVRLIGDETQEVYEVLEIDEKEHKKFRTAFKPAGEKVFVYGREVNDFRVVDYDAISMLNVSATQQIKKEKDAEVKALQDENTALRERVAALEAADKTRDAKLAAIEKLLSGDKSIIRTASLKAE